MADKQKALRLLNSLYENDDRKHFQAIRENYEEIRAALTEPPVTSATKGQ